jgi:hypothetical protein
VQNSVEKYLSESILPNVEKKSIFFAKITGGTAELPLIIVKSQQIAAKYWSYQPAGTFSGQWSRVFLLRETEGVTLQRNTARIGFLAVFVDDISGIAQRLNVL